MKPFALSQGLRPYFWIGALLCGLVWAMPQQAMAGLLRIASKPAGAALYINGSKRGRTPFSGKLNPGRYHVEIRRRGFLTWTSYIELPHRADIKVRALLEKRTGANAARAGSPPNAAGNANSGQRGGLLIINTKPSGVAVYKGDKYLGQTPLLKFIPVGRHAITLQLSGYQQVSRLVRIQTSKSVRIKVKMVPGSGGSFRMRKRVKKISPNAASGGGSTMLMIKSRPKAKVYLNNRYMGRTPLISAGIKAGNYQLVLKRRGYLPYRRTLQLVGGETTRIKARLVRGR